VIRLRRMLAVTQRKKKMKMVLSRT